MQLTEHFSLAALIASETAARKNIDNNPPPEILANLYILAQGLELVRSAVGERTILVNSGYRSPALNREIGGAEKSKHMSGLAADIVCPQFGTPLDLCRAIVAAGIATDQVIHEFGKWCHVSFPAAGATPKGDLLTIASVAQGYVEGLNPVA
jgi:hypothetical protein